MNLHEIETGILDALDGSVPSLMGASPYAGEFEEVAERLPMRLPAAYVLYGGSEFSRLDGYDTEERAVFTVLLACGATSGSKGVYALLPEVLGALANNDLGLDMEPLNPEKITLVHGTEGLLVYGIKFTAGFDAGGGPGAGGPA